MKIEQDFSLQHFNTFRLAVKARWFIEYENDTEPEKILKDENFRDLPFLHIGRGSNLLFLNDFNGIVLHSAIKGIELINETENTVYIRVGAAEIWEDVVAYTVDKDWGGIENLSLIPGETGAAAAQNIGAYGVEISDVIERVEVINTSNFEKRFFLNDECDYGYRNSIFKSTKSYIITYVTLRLQKKPVFNLEYGNLHKILSSKKTLTLQQVREAIIAKRQKIIPDPSEVGNAGSFFMNPVVTLEKLAIIQTVHPEIPYFPAKNGFVKLSAGWLIEQCGLKGRRFGQVGIYEHHALVIVHYGGATGNEIALLADHICKTVYQRFGVQLEMEVKYIGELPPPTPSEGKQLGGCISNCRTN